MGNLHSWRRARSARQGVCDGCVLLLLPMRLFKAFHGIVQNINFMTEIILRLFDGMNWLIGTTEK